MKIRSTNTPLTPLCITLIFGCTLAATASDLRPLSADRPDTTESPYTVDKGHWQIETELASWSFDGSDLESVSLATMNVKFGISDCSDLQLVLPCFSNVRQGDEGFGDIQLRLKHNLWGNDNGDQAFALMPYIKFPSARGNLGNDELETGIALPFAFEGPADWSLGLMGQIDLVSDEDNSGMQPQALVSFAAGHDLTNHTAMFIELASILTPEGSEAHEAYFNAGLTWSVSETIQWDTGIRMGLTSPSTDWSPFLGLTMKY